jgi:predicted glycoside hydrolase/deacetylase ChbG (UPF0249 family)
MSGVILNADDYAMTQGISDAILALAEAGRLSATSAIVTTRHWPAHAREAVLRRDRIAIGLHLNLTFGAPLGAMPSLAPDGIFPGPGAIVRNASARRLDRAEIRGEIERQLDRFEAEAGFPPDFVDGHHHVHVLPGVRDELLAAMGERFPAGGPLVRDPFDSPARILRRRVAAGKALTAAWLGAGFRRAAEAAGFPTNRGFSGFSTFGAVPYADEFDAFLVAPGPRHMIMCHPGLPDDELGDSDTIRHRRPEEYALLSRRDDIPDIIWRPERAAEANVFPW